MSSMSNKSSIHAKQFGFELMLKVLGRLDFGHVAFQMSQEITVMYHDLSKRRVHISASDFDSFCAACVHKHE